VGNHAATMLCFHILIQRRTQTQRVILIYHKDYFIKLDLKNKNRIIKTKRTSVCRQQSQPEFNESVKFTMDDHQLSTSCLTISLYQADDKGEYHTVRWIAYCIPSFCFLMAPFSSSRILNSVKGLQNLPYWVFWFNHSQGASLGDFLFAPMTP